MQCHTLTNNAICITHNEIDYLYSFDTLQAYRLKEHIVKAKPKASITTEKHIRLFANYVGCENSVVRVDIESFYGELHKWQTEIK